MLHIVALAWLFVVILMAAAEGMRSGLFPALLTLLFYGILPLSLVLYILATPARRKRRARLEQEAQEVQAQGTAAAQTPRPDAATQVTEPSTGTPPPAPSEPSSDPGKV